MPVIDHEPDGPLPGRHDREGRERALLDAATAVFAERGYDAATTREIAERAGCSEGLIHRYFGGKRGLLRVVLHVKSEVVAEQFANNVPPSSSLLEEVTAILRDSWVSLSTHHESVRVHLSCAIIDAEIGLEVGALFEDQRARLIRERLERHQALGAIGREVDLDAISHTISGMGFVSGFLGAVVYQKPAEEIERTLAEFARVLVRGISPS